MEQDELWDAEEDAEQYNPRPSRRKSQRGGSLPDTQPAYELAQEMPLEASRTGLSSADPVLIASSAPQDDAGDEAAFEPPRTQKKRGRKKKEAAVVESAAAAPETSSTPATTQDIAATPAAKTKKKRGRPRKSVSKTEDDPSVAPSDVQAEAVFEAPGPDEDPHEADDVAWSEPVVTGQTPKTKKAKGRKAAGKMPASTEEPSSSVQSRAALSDKTNVQGSQPNSSPEKYEKPTATTEETKENPRTTADSVGKKVAAKEVKVEGTSNAQGKVPYRVGLSKRSRIPSLLKIIRK